MSDTTKTEAPKTEGPKTEGADAKAAAPKAGHTAGKKLLSGVHVVHSAGTIYAIYADRIDALEDAIERGTSKVTELGFGDDVQKALGK